jgi:hypothetical protein
MTDRRGPDGGGFEESQRLRGRWRWWTVVAVLVVSLVAVVLGRPRPAVAAGLVAVPVGLAAVTWLARLRTSVRDDGVHVRFLPLHPRPRVVRFDDVVGVERVTVSALGDYGGVGIRRDHDSWAYIVESGEALRFERRDRPDVVVGSARVGEFHRAVRAARGADGDPDER